MREEIKVKQISEREFMVGESRHYLGDDNIVYVIAVGECDEKIANAHQELNIRFMDMVKGRTNFLIDLNRAGKQSPEARKLWKEIAEHEKIGKVALFGLHPVARVLASFVMSITKKGSQRFFKTKEEALAWLKERNNG